MIKSRQKKTPLDFKKFEDASPIAMYTCDQYGYITFCNKAAIQLWGRKPKIGVDLWCGSWKIYYPDGRPMPAEQCPMAKTLIEGRSFKGNEITIERPDHTFRNLLVFPRPVFDKDNQITGAHNLLVDITEQKKNEAKQRVLSAIVESSDDAIISKNLNGIILTWNAGAERILGYTETEIIGKHIGILIPPDLQSEEDAIIQNIKNGVITDHYETTRLHKKGWTVHVSLTVSPIKDSHGVIIGASKIARDITQRIIRENLVKESEKSLNLLNAVSKVIAEKMDVQSILQHVIDAAIKIAGAEIGAFFYQTTDELGVKQLLFSLAGVPNEAFKTFDIKQDAHLLQLPYSEKYAVIIADTSKDARYGKTFMQCGLPPAYLPVLSYMAIPLLSSAGQIFGELSFGHSKPDTFKENHKDMIVSIASQTAVALENFKLFKEVKTLSSKKDEFIALASHELKTPLTTIKGYLQILNKTDKDERSKIFVQKTITQVDKLNSLVTDLFDISKIEAGKLQLYMETFNLRDLIIDVIETFHYTNKTHQIVFRDTKQVFIEADKRRIEQVIINLLTNAIKYSPKSDKITVELQQSAIALTVKIRDEGVGLTEDQQTKIFTRFYRAEGTSNIPGLGLGLYISKDIIERHQGELIVHSEPGKGSEFLFSLPFNQ